MFGEGIYFANNSGYSHSYAYSANGIFEMFVCFVLPGHSAHNPPDPTRLRIPPLKDPSNPDSVERFDTVTNADRSHTITYSNAKSYPAYLISYQP